VTKVGTSFRVFDELAAETWFRTPTGVSVSCRIFRRCGRGLESAVRTVVQGPPLARRARSGDNPQPVTDARTLALAASVARYHAGCLRVIGAQNVAQTDVRTSKKAAYPCDLGQLSDTETLLRYRQSTVVAPEPPPVASPEERERYQQRLTVWERLRELATKAAVEAHQKEVIYAGPLLSGVLYKKNAGTCEPVLAPLFLQTVTVEAQPDGSVLITATDEPPRFNTSVWAGAFHKTQADQIVTLGIDAQADLADGWHDERVDELLRGIKAVFPALSLTDVDDRLAPWPERPTPAQAAKLQPHARLHSGTALYLANKSSPYLLADLDRVAEAPAAVVHQERPLSVLLSPPADEVRPELEHLDIHEVVFPFPSNGPQRRVVDAVDKNRIVVVQGPPGNGKSLTIANLVAHLVAEGKSVLVASHKEQALTVVRDKLDEMDLRFLYASMVGTSANTKRELQGQIQDVRGFFGRVNQHTLRSQLKEVTERRRRNGEHYQELRDDFNDRAEAEQAEAEALLLSIEGVSLVPAEDPVVADADRDRVARELRRLDALAREHRTVWADLCASDIAAETATCSRQAALIDFLELQSARLAAAEDAAVQDLVRQWQPVAERDPGQVDAARAAVGAIAEALGEPVAAIDDDPEPERVRDFARALAANADLLTEARAAIEKVSAALATARERQDARNHLKADVVARRHEVLARHAELGSVFKRKSARRWLDEYAPGAAGLTGEQVQAWAGFWDAWQRVRDDCDALGERLRLEVPERYDPTAVTNYLARLRRAVAVANAVEAARAPARRQTTLRLGPEPLVAELTRDAIDLHTERWQRALTALSADRAGNALKDNAALLWLNGRLKEADAAVDQERYDEARTLLDELRGVLAALPGLAERARILAGPTGALRATVAAIEAAAARELEAPAFLADLAAAFAAQPVVARLAEIRSGQSTRALAEELGSLRDTILADARQYLSLRIQERIYEGFRRPKFNASLERFRKAISTSAKRFDRIEELKNSPEFDVDVLTEVFPCWIMRPEDACRMFPLRHDIFDVVIFDEASQCNPDQTLPIFARARHAVVFGDENQLSNEDLKRSLAGDANKALLRQSGLTELDPAGVFDQTENSLLGLVSFRDQAPIVLNEHFRCRPELVAFSNNRFYADGLRVMRDAEDDRGLGPAILIHELQGVPTLGKTKINTYEAQLLVAELERLLGDRRYDGLSIGVLSLFREQIEHIEALVEQRIPKAVRERRRLICSTVDGFQGDERDVILYSWRYSTSQSPSILAFTNGKTGDQRVNVALTRARHQAIHFISAPVERFPQAGNAGQFLQHAAVPQRLVHVIEGRAHKEPITEARHRAAAALRANQLGVAEQFVACGVGVDLVVHDPQTWARVAVFIDGRGDPEPPPTADRRVDAQGLLERAGWTVERVLAEEALGDRHRLVTRLRLALERCGPRQRPDLDAERHFSWDVEPEPEDELVGAVTTGTSSSIAREDYADYHWPAPTVEARLAAGEDVFQSDFERELYDRLARDEDLQVVPQWRSRGKFIDLVITDRAGRRLAIEADGEQHHETVDGELIPEDVYRQELLEEVGWVFHRVRFTDFSRDPDRHTDDILRALAARPANPQLAAEVWGEDATSLDELERAVATDDVQPVDLGVSGGSVAMLQERSADTDEATLTDEDLERLQDAARSELDDQEALPLADGSTDDPADAYQATAEPEADAAADDGDEALVEYTEPEALDLDPEAYDGAHLHDVPLALLPQQIAIVVAERGAVEDEQVADAYAEHFGIEVPRNRRRLLTSFAWSAGGRRFIEKDGERWIPAAVAPHPIEHLGSWTLTQLEHLVRELVDDGVHEDDLFEQVLAIVWTSEHRVPRPVTKAVGSAIYAAVGKRR
jgi:very-short-patch-repair endonuclease